MGSRVSLDEARLLFISACGLITVLPGVALVGQKPCAELLLADAEIYIVSHSTDADAQVIIAGGDEEGITELFITGRRGIVDIDADFEDGRTDELPCFLQPRVLYTMDVIGIAENGNRTVADVQFTTGR